MPPEELSHAATTSETERKYLELFEKLTVVLDRVLPTKNEDSAKPNPSVGDTDKLKTTKALEEASTDQNGETKIQHEQDSVKPLRVRTVISRWDHSKESRQDFEISNTSTTPSVPSASDTALNVTCRKVMDIDDDKKYHYSEVEIDGPELRKLLAEYMVHYPPRTFEARVTYESPFRPLIYNWDKLLNACETLKGDTPKRKDAREDLRMMMKYVKSTSELEGYFKNRDVHIANKTIEFSNLWTLFGAGTFLYAKSFFNDMQMFESQGTITPDETIFNRGTPTTIVYCAAYDWDGSQFRRYTYKFPIKKFDGPRAVKTLPCFPIRYYQDEAGDFNDSALRKSLIERGRRFCGLCTAKSDQLQCEYDGLLMAKTPGMARLAPDDDDDDSRSLLSSSDQDLPTGSKSLRIKAKIIVDNYSYLHSSRNASAENFPPLGELRPVDGARWDCQCTACRNGPTQNWETPSGDGPDEGGNFASSETRLLLCPPKVLGYVLTRKIWGQFRVKDAKSCQPVDPASTLFDTKLELDARHKKLLKAFIDNHERVKKAKPSKSGAQVTDLIEGKGKGLVILLHGPPGVGKTLTAETVALACKRPLLPVSIADIGMLPSEAEQNLVDIFADANRWEAVLLIDEADVFLENRVESTDTSRNVLVSVLLRVLEYYDGIIILTTNRITSLDVAVQSRIHLAIQYQDLKPEQKVKIFKNFLEQIGEENIKDPDEVNRELKNICRRSPINGRQIRNIVSSAQALATAENKKVSAEHLQIVYETTIDFLDSLKDLTRERRGRNEVDVL